MAAYLSNRFVLIVAVTGKGNIGVHLIENHSNQLLSCIHKMKLSWLQLVSAAKEMNIFTTLFSLLILTYNLVWF